MDRQGQPQPWTPLATFPHLVWREIYASLDRESMTSIRKLTLDLDLYIPIIYNPTLELDKVMPLLFRYLRPTELLSFRKLNSFWRHCTDNCLDLQCSDWRGEIDMRKPSSYRKFSYAADFEAFDDAFGLLDVHPVIHRRVVLNVPNNLQQYLVFMAAAEPYLNKFGPHIWHLRIETSVHAAYQHRRLGDILFFVMKCLDHAPFLKTFHWSTKFLERLKEEQIVGVFGHMNIPQLLHLQKFELVPFRFSLWSILVNAFKSSLNVLEIDCHRKWLAVSTLRVEQLRHLKMDVTPEDYPYMSHFTLVSRWQLSSLYIIFEMNSPVSVIRLTWVIRQNLGSLEKLSIILKTPKSDAFSQKYTLNLLQQELRQIPNLKWLQLTNFVEESFDCLRTFVPKVETLELTNCVLLKNETKIFNGNWQTECWNNVKIDPQAWGVLKSLKEVVITADTFNVCKKYNGNLKFSRIIHRPNN